MRRFISGFFKTIGVMTFILIICICLFAYRLVNPGAPSLKGHDTVVLELTIGDENLPQHYQQGKIMTFLQGQPLSVHNIVEGIKAASKDDRIKGILMTVVDDSLKLASVQEIRDALKEFRESGKFVYSYSDTFGELSNGTLAFYLASVSSKIWLMPMGSLNYLGMMIEMPFGKKALEDFKLRPQMGHREEYKGAIEFLTESDFSTPHKQNMQKILDGLTAQIVNDIASDRKIDTLALQQVMNDGPCLPQQAVEKKLVDVAGYKDEIKAAIKKLLPVKPEYCPFETYAQTLKPANGERIAIVYAEGDIMRGKVRQNPLSDSMLIDSCEIAKNIREAADDETIKAIILRIDSGGGSPIGSEIIGREVERAKLKKPFVVSMANYAASGGYWIACNAHKIVAQPGTITGSIGVFAGKIVTHGLWENYGVHWGELHSGDNAGIWSSGQDFTDKGWKALNASLDHIYQMFIDKVSKGRNMSREQVHGLAKGQVWTGQQARENGLVDELGGLDTAIEISRKEAKLAPDAPLTLIHLPIPKSIIELVTDRGNNMEASILARYPYLNKMLGKVESLFSDSTISLKAQHTDIW